MVIACTAWLCSFTGKKHTLQGAEKDRLKMQENIVVDWKKDPREPFASCLRSILFPPEKFGRRGTHIPFAIWTIPCFCTMPPRLTDPSRPLQYLAQIKSTLAFTVLRCLFWFWSCSCFVLVHALVLFLVMLLFFIRFWFGLV